jgi:dolichyl-phosphate-mannose-protein mannosyltransferase
LPQWGFKQEEVVCQKHSQDESENNYWNIENHVNELMPSGGAAAYQTYFFRDFIDLNIGMYDNYCLHKVDFKQCSNTRS